MTEEKKLNQRIVKNNIKKGFWDDRINIPRKMEKTGCFTEKEITSVRKAIKSQMLMLIVSELSEAMEADRKDLKDDKLPQYDGFDVELIDADIRLRDVMEGLGINYEEIREAKMKFNEGREKMHGKSY